MSIAVIVQARMASTRLPGKTLADLNGKPVLQHVIDRTRDANLHRIIIATTWNPEDDPIATLAKQAKVRCFRGHPNNVLARIHHAHALFEPNSDTIVRVTADCPLLNPQLLYQVAEAIQQGGHDYVGVQGAPDGHHQEAFTARALTITHKLATTPYDREHVVTYMLERPAMFRIGWIKTDIQGDPVTLDTQEDLDRLRELVARKDAA